MDKSVTRPVELICLRLRMILQVRRIARDGKGTGIESSSGGGRAGIRSQGGKLCSYFDTCKHGRQDMTTMTTFFSVSIRRKIAFQSLTTAFGADGPV